MLASCADSRACWLHPHVAQQTLNLGRGLARAKKSVAKVSRQVFYCP